MIRLSSSNIDALKRTTMSEVGHFGKYGTQTLKCGAEAVVDTIINRVAHPRFPKSISSVVNAPYQFSAIGGPRGVGSWSKLRRASSSVSDIVDNHLSDRINGKSSTVKGATHFLNPNYSSASAMREWGSYVVNHAVRTCGKGRDIHYHGFAPGFGNPKQYTLELDGQTQNFSGAGQAKIPHFNEQDQELSSENNVMSIDAFQYDESEVNQSIEPDQLDLIEYQENEKERFIYSVERIALEGTDAIEAALNNYALSGWDIVQIIPDKKDLILIMRGTESSSDEEDDSIDQNIMNTILFGGERARELLVAEGLREQLIDNDYMAKFANFMSDKGISHFKPEEFLTFGGHHYSGPCRGKNTLPPESIWNNIIPTARVLNVLRDRLKHKITFNSVYRSNSYNACLKGAASGSFHKQFKAIDFTCADGKGSVFWASQLKMMRDKGLFKGGIGVYPTFVHVDTRGYNANFGPWRDRVF